MTCTLEAIPAPLGQIVMTFLVLVLVRLIQPRLYYDPPCLVISVGFYKSFQAGFKKLQQFLHTTNDPV